VLTGLITDRLDCDVFRIEASDPYPDSYDSTRDRNVDEQNDDARPGISGDLPSTDGYDTVLLGSPIWNVRPPMLMSTFAEQVDLTGVQVIPFVTYAVSELGSTMQVYRDLIPGGSFGTPLAIRGEDVSDDDTGTQVDRWLRRNTLI
jgi:flavodoxin